MTKLSIKYLHTYLKMMSPTPFQNFKMSEVGSFLILFVSNNLGCLRYLSISKNSDENLEQVYLA